MKKSMLLGLAWLLFSAAALAQTAPPHTTGRMPHPKPAVDSEAVSPSDSAPQHAKGPIAHASSESADGVGWLLAGLTAEPQRRPISHSQAPSARPAAPVAHASDQPGEKFPFLFKQMGVSELKNVGLSDEQIQQINQIYQNNRDRLNQLNAEVKQRENDLRFLLDNTQVDSAQAEQQVDALVEARGRLSKATSMMMVQMRQVMTAEQWFKLADLQQRLPVAHRARPTHFSGAPRRLAPGVYSAGKDGVSAPQLMSKIEPQYTEKARSEKVEGTIVLSIVVGTDGVPRDIQVLGSLDPGLDQKAMEAVSQWKFQPGMKNGQPVPVACTVEVTFRLR